MIGLPLQAAFFLDFVPRWLSTAVITAGLLVLAGHVYTEIFRALDRHSVGVLGYVTNATAALFLGAGAAAIVGVLPWYFAGHWVMVGLLGFLGQWIQGLSTVRFLQKLYIAATERRWAGSGLRKRAGYLFVGFFALTLVAWGVVYAFLFTSAVNSVTYSVLVGWTLVVFVTSLLGLVWRVKGAYGVLPTSLLVGFVLMISGASIQNLTFVADVKAMLLGNLGYVGGYLAALAIWIREER